MSYNHNAECRRKNGGDLTQMMRVAITPTKPMEKLARTAASSSQSQLQPGQSQSAWPATALKPQEFSIETPPPKRVEKRNAETSPGTLKNEAAAAATPERHGEKRGA